MSDNIIIWGNSNFAELIYNYIKTDNRYTVAAFCVDDKYALSQNFCDLPLIKYSQLKSFPPSKYKFFVAIGYTKINSVRKEVYMRLKELNYEFISYIHPSNIIANNSQVGENCMLLENNVIEPYAIIEDNVFIWGNSFISHNIKIKKHSFVAAGTVIGGYTEIGEESFIGLNTTLKDKINIGKKCLIGAGSIILKNLEDYSVNIPESTKSAKFTSEQYIKYGLDI